MKDHIQKLNIHLQKKGIEGLLPQNLPSKILARMIAEIESIENNSTEKPSSTLLLAILSLQNGDKISTDISELKINFDSEGDLMNKFFNYALNVKIENMRRSKQIFIPDESLPTLKNIFDNNWKV